MHFDEKAQGIVKLLIIETKELMMTENDKKFSTSLQTKLAFLIFLSTFDNSGFILNQMSDQFAKSEDEMLKFVLQEIVGEDIDLGTEVIGLTALLKSSYKVRSKIGLFALSHSLLLNSIMATRFIIENGDDAGLSPIIQDQLIFKLARSSIDNNTDSL